MTTVCRLYGVDVASPYVLGHLAPGESADVWITVEEAQLEPSAIKEPAGRVVASHAPDVPQYVLVDRGRDGFLYRIHGLVDIEISPDQRHLRCHLVEGGPDGLLPVVLTGHVMATLLLLRGDLVLHASAVERDGRAIAFVTNSGGGKSTLAAMACRAGANLVSDDVLRVEDETGTVSCYRGAAALRLRPSSKALLDAPEEAIDRSADGRHLLTSMPTVLDKMPLDAIFIPRLREADHPLARTVVAPKAALFALLEFPRVYGWSDPVTSAAHFETLARVVEHIPVYFLDVPWGVSVDAGLFERLSDLLFVAA